MSIADFPYDKRVPYYCMQELFEFRINYDFAHLLFETHEGKDLGQISKTVKVVRITREDPRFDQIPIISKQIKNKYNRGFFFGWKIIRKYSKHEINDARMFHILFRSTFEPSGEMSGTKYDEISACTSCGANRKQIGPLRLKKGSIPKKDVARTIAGEIVVSEKFKKLYRKRKLSGVSFQSVFYKQKVSPWHQLINNLTGVELDKQTMAGINPFDFSHKSGSETYKCPKGHTIGLNLLSEAYIKDNKVIKQHDILITKQNVGVNRGLLRPEPIYLCSPRFKNMVEEEKLRGFSFEIAHIVDNKK